MSTKNPVVEEDLPDVGKLAEKYFDTLCTKTNLQINESVEDGTGWDFLVEAKNQIQKSSTNPDQLHLSAMQFKVQVKGSYTSNKSTEIKLSNAIRMCTDPLPYFILLLEFDKANLEEKCAYLIHVDNDLISKVMLKVRQLDIESPDRKLNKHNWYPSATDSMIVNPSNLTEVLNTFSSYIGPDQGAYSKRKIDYLESVGFENGRERLMFDVRLGSNEPALIDTAMGLVDTISGTNFKAFKKRFDLLDLNPYREIDEGLIGILPNPEYVDIVFRFSLMSPEIVFTASLYTTALNTVLPESERRVRISGSWFEIIFNPSLSGSCNLDVSFENPIEISELQSVCKLFNLIETSDRDIEVHMRTKDKEALLFSIKSRQEKSLPVLTVEAIDSATTIVQHFGHAPTGPVILDKIAGLHSELRFFVKVLESNWNPPSISTQAIGVFNPIRSEFAILGLFFCPIGPNIYILAFAATGPAKHHADGRFEIENPSINVIDKFVLDRAGDIERKNMNVELERLGKTFETSHNVLINFITQNESKIN